MRTLCSTACVSVAGRSRASPLRRGLHDKEVAHSPAGSTTTVVSLNRPPAFTAAGSVVVLCPESAAPARGT
jgi:hypothetical protein